MVPVLEKSARVLASLPVRNCTRNDNGAVLVEAAIVLPVIVLVILGGLDLGLGMLVATRLNFATETAARCVALAVSPCTDPTSTAEFAVEQSGVPANFNFNPPPPLSSGASGMETATASYAYSFMFLPWTINLQSSASYSYAIPTQPPS